MSLIEEKLTDQFYEWELRGRGWQVWDRPIPPEPPFRPFYGHYFLPEPIPDDGRRPTLLSSLFEKVRKGLGSSDELEPVPQFETEPQPEILERDSQVEFQVSLPASLITSKEAIEQFFSSLASCHEPIAFELIGTADSIITQISASKSDANRVKQQLEAHFHDVVIVQQEEFLEQQWHKAEGSEILIVDFGLSREFMFSLATMGNFKIDPFIGITGALSELKQEEIGLFQVIFQPVNSPWGESMLRSVTDGHGRDFFVNTPELVSATKVKIARPLYAAVVRMAIKTHSYDRSIEIARSLGGALTVYSNPPGNALIPLDNSEYPLADHEEDVLCRQTRRTGMLLNSDELISLVHLPSASVRTPKLRREAQKTKASPANVWNNAGIVLGDNVHSGKTYEVRLLAEQRVRHMHCVGASGTGKSTFLFNLIQQDIENGQGLAVLDPHGDLIEKILGSIPKDRIKDVVLVDPSDEEYSVGFNILAAHSDLEKNVLASDLVSIFERLATSWGDQMNSVLHNAILAFLESKKCGTLVDLRRFLIEPEFRIEFLKTINDPEVLYYWKKAFPLLTGNKSVGPIVTRLDTFLARKPIRHMVSQKENRLDAADIMNSGKILLAKLSQGKIGKENAYLLGSFLVSKFQQAAMARQDMPENERKDFWLYLDEFHNFITPSMAEILSGARKYRLGLVLAHQELRQMQRDSDVSSAVLSNCYTRVCFRLGDNDAKALESGFSFFESKDLQNLGTGQAICRVERSDFDFNISIPFLPEPAEKEANERRREVTTASRGKYSVSRQEIEAEHFSQIQDGSASPTAKGERKRILRKEDEAIPLAQEQAKEQESIASPKTLSDPLEPEEPVIAEETQDRGIGGHQHNLIRERIELVARQLGYSASRENPIAKGQKIDLLLEKAGRTIACEIAITTTIDHEVGNVSKCLKADFKEIAVISPSADKLEKIRAAVSASLPGNVETVKYFHPDSFIDFLQNLSIQDGSEAAAEPGKEKRYGKYRVKSSVANLSPEEIKARESAALGVLAETMRRKQ